MLIAHALLSAGNFWNLQDEFEKIPGILGSQVGYTGGNTPNPVYSEVIAGKNGHIQAVELTFDRETIDYETILERFIEFQNSMNNEHPYSAVFYFNDEQKIAAQNKINKKEHPQIELRAATEFYPAEAYHQHYITKPGQTSCCLTKEC